MLPRSILSRKGTPLIFAIWVTGSMALYADLKWDTQKVELTPAVTDAFADAKFGFVNKGSSEVVIEEVRSACGCTVPTLEKKNYAPGERGEVLAHFLIGDRRGVQEKTIRVFLRGERNPTELTLVVKIPEALRITPAVLVWEEGEQPTPKTFAVQAQPGYQVRVRKATATALETGIKIEAVTEAKDYRITVTPKNTQEAGVALVTIEALVMEKPKLFEAYLQIKPKPR